MQDYTLGDAARILKVSPRRLRYWQQTQLFEPLSFEGGSGGYAFRDLVCLRAIVSLLDKGIPLQRIRRNLEMLRDRLPEIDEPATALRLWDENSDRIAVRRDGRFEEAGGQLLLDFESESREAYEAVIALADMERSTSVPVSVTGRDALAWFERGCELDSDPDHWEAAIEAYEKALELEPELGDAFCNLGAVRYNQGARRKARAAFEACLAQQPGHVEANFNLANVLEEEGEDVLALEHYRKALAGDPLYADLHINLALLYEKLGRTRPACEHWRRYLQLDPRGSWSEVARLRLHRRAEAPPGDERQRP